MEIHERIKQRRKEIGLSADDVAVALGVSRATVYRYESKDIEKLPLDIVEPLARALQCSIAYIMGWEEKTEPASALVLTDEEIEVILAYRQTDDIGRLVVQRSLGIDELLEFKKHNTPPY